MRPGPPRTAEAMVRLLLPPACREHVLGDLHERYKSRRQYVGEALRTVPLVIVSRIRRTTDPQVLLMEALLLYLSFVTAAWALRQMPFLLEQQGLLRLAVPTYVTLLVLVLEDAYASPGKRSPLMPLLEAALGVACAFLSQAVSNRDWAVPRWIMLWGGGMSLLLVATLRMLFPPDSKRPRGAT